MPIKTKTLPATLSHTEKGHVYVEKSSTVSLGDHQFAKVTVGVELPLEPTSSDVKAANEAIRVAVSIVDKHLAAQIDLL